MRGNARPGATNPQLEKPLQPKYNQTLSLSLCFKMFKIEVQKK